jgi:hypothetical protein
MDNEDNIADVATLYPQISKKGQDSLANMAQIMLSIQNSDGSLSSDQTNKEKFVSQVFPKISHQGQEYLDKILHAMLLIQVSAGGGKK